MNSSEGTRQQRIFFTSIRPQHSPPSNQRRRRQQHSGEFAWWDLCKHAKKKKNSLKEESEWGKGKEKNNCLLQSTNKKEKREKNCCLLIVTEVFMLPLFFFFLLAVCLSIKQNSNERINTWRSPFAFTINRRLLFAFSSPLHSITICYVYILRTLHALYCGSDDVGEVAAAAGERKKRKCIPSRRRIYMRNNEKSGNFLLSTLCLFMKIYFTKNVCVRECVYSFPLSIVCNPRFISFFYDFSGGVKGNNLLPIFELTKSKRKKVRKLWVGLKNTLFHFSLLIAYNKYLNAFIR